MVYVLNIAGHPLMPTERHGKVRKLLKDGKARVVKREPFTIQLLYETQNITQPITLGIDLGSQNIGFSATTEKQELICGEVELRKDVKDNLYTRKFLRRSRRNRKTRYRKPRFLNRVKSKKEGWLAPSIEQKINSHIQLVNKLKKILPISKIILEIGNFDTQKIENPDIHGIEDQQGSQLDFWNVREYVLFRDNHICQACNGKSHDSILEVHHKIQRKDGGSDSPKNLITLCKTCHENYHKGILKYSLDQAQRDKGLKDAAHMNIMKWAIYNRLRGNNPDLSIDITYGYLTKSKRIDLNLGKQHYNDAYCIANNLLATNLDSYYKFKCIRNHNRSLHKMNPSKGGIRKPNILPKYMFGYQINDKVRLLTTNEIGYITSRRKTGSFTIKDINGNMVNSGITYKKLSLLESRSSMLCSYLKK